MPLPRIVVTPFLVSGVNTATWTAVDPMSTPMTCPSPLVTLTVLAEPSRRFISDSGSVSGWAYTSERRCWLMWWSL